jgi:hypothetical protein
MSRQKKADSLITDKGGHLQFKSAPPQYCGQQNPLWGCGLKKLRNCNCGPSKFDFRNFATFPSPLPVRYFLVPFPQLRMVLKIKQKYF